MFSRQQVIASRKAQRQEQQEKSQLSNVGKLIEYLTDLGATKLSDVRISKKGRPYVAFYNAAGENLDIIMFSKELQRLHGIKPFTKLDLIELPVYAGQATTQQGVDFIWTAIGVEGTAPNDLTDIADIINQRNELLAASKKLGKVE